MLKCLRILLAAVPLLVVLPLSLTAQGNYMYHWSAGFSGDCSSTEDARLYRSLINKLVTTNATRTFETLADCEASRGRNTYTSTEYGCTARVYCSPCVRIGGGMTVGDMSYLGEYQLLGPEQGMASFTSNPADEIRQWEDEWERKKKTLAYDDNGPGLLPVTTGDMSFDKEYSKLINGGENIVSVTDRASTKGRGVSLSDDFLRGSFQSLNMREPWTSDDLSKVDDVPSERPDLDYSYRRPEHPWVEWGADLMKDVVDIGFMFIKEAGFVAGILAEANINLYKEVIDCILDQCTDANQIFKDAWNVDFVALAKKSGELFGNVNGFVPAGSLGVSVPYHEIPEAQRTQDPIIVDKAVLKNKVETIIKEEVIGAVSGTTVKFASESAAVAFVATGKLSVSGSEKLLKDAALVGKVDKGVKVLLKAIENRPVELED